MSQLALPGQILAQDTAEDGVVSITFRGDLDALTAPAISGHLARIARTMPRVMIYDLGDVGFLDCAAARTLIETGRGLPGRPRLIVRHPRPVVRRLLSLTGLDSRCTVEL
jgi:anti-anti-sigma factor